MKSVLNQVEWIEHLRIGEEVFVYQWNVKEWMLHLTNCEELIVNIVVIMFKTNEINIPNNPLSS